MYNNMQCQMLHVNHIQNALHYNSEIILPVFSVAYTEETHTERVLMSSQNKMDPYFQNTPQASFTMSRLF